MNTFRTNAQLAADLERHEHDFNVSHGCTCYIGEREDCTLHGSPRTDPFYDSDYTTRDDGGDA